jgi:diaminopimelate epimerase
LGGEINIKFNYNGEIFTQVFLEGPAKQVFNGNIEV